MKKQFSLPEDTTAQSRAAFQFAMLLLAGTSLSFFVFLYQAFQTQTWQVFVTAGLCFLLACIALITAWLSQKGHHTVGVRLMIAAQLMVPSFTAFLLSNNIGSIIGIVVFATNLLVVVRTLPQKYLPRFIFLGLAAIGIATLIDSVAPVTQLSLSSTGTVILIIGGLTILVSMVLIVREFRNISLASKLLLTFIMITFIPFLTLGFLLLRVTSQSLRDTVGSNLKALSDSQAAQIGAMLANEEESLRLLALNPRVAEPLAKIDLLLADDPASLKQQESRWKTLPDTDPLVQQILNHPIAGELDDHLNTISDNMDILVTDQYGAVIAATRRPIHYYVADEEWWQGALDGDEEDVFISQPIIDRDGDPLSIYVAVPITSTVTNETIGVLRATYLTQAFIQVLKQEASGSRIGADLLLSQGRVYRVEGDIVTFDEATHASLDATANDVYGQFFYDEGPSLVSQSRVITSDTDLAPMVDHLGWRVIHDESTEEALQPVRDLTRGGIYSGLVVLLLITFVAIWLSRWISFPIIQLTETAQKITDGDLEAQMNITSKDEIGVLSTTFNSMTTQLKQTLQDVQQQTTALQTSTTALSRQTFQLRAATDVSRAVSSISKVEGLMQQAVELICNRFNLYYVGLFLIDETGRLAVLKAGTGEAGHQMLADAYQIEINDDTPTGQSIIQQETSIVTEAQSNNPLLPNTHAELVLPLISQGRVIGVISFQSEETSAFESEDVIILQTMTDQLANVLEKARLYEQIQQRAVELDVARAAAEDANRSLAAQMWQTAGQAGLNDKIRGEQDIATLAQNVIQHLCKYLEIYSGAIYVLEKNTLQLKGTYAHIQKSFAPQYRIGEEMVGQAALEKNTILHQMPEAYITLGLSQEKVLPKFRLFAPVISNQQVSGVIALEAMTEFTPAQKHFVEEAVESVAIALMTAQARARVDELFAQTRQQAEELQAQEEELRATNEELEAQTESLRTSETRLRNNQTALEVANAELEENSYALREKQTTLDQQNQILRNAQQELERKAEELTITNKYKSEFLANMSHELRTPLNSLLILSGILAKNEGGNLTHSQIESAQIIYASGSDLLQLINDILDLSKVEAGHMNFTFAPMPLTDLAQTMRLQFHHIAKQKDLQFEITLANGLPESIITDQQRVEQIIKNLLSNAFKFTEKGTIHLNIEPDENMVAIRVGDSGIGMTPEQQQRVFEAFQQADGSTSRKYGGTGLGLTISREMTAKLGGRMGLESEPGKGSVFTLYLPPTPPEAEIAAPPEAAPVSAPVPPAERETANPPAAVQPPSWPVNTLNDDRDHIQPGDKVLLVIEDDPRFIKVLFDYAHQKNFKCLLAYDGESGLKLATMQTPDAILLDLKLPGMSGWDVLDTLKDDSNLRHIPVHILSATDHSIDAYKRGALGFLSKPISQAQLDNVFSTLGEFISREIKSLLLVEDDNGLRHSVGQLLGGNDVQISEAASGQAALALLHERHFDCIILDLTLPDMTGFELLNKISHDGKISKCPVIVYTGQALTEEENAELLKYASSVIIKGVKSPERLLDETALFLHRVVADMPAEKQNTIHLLHNRDAVFSGKHILVVDDNIRNAFALSSLLTSKKLKVTIARSGMKALEMLDTVPEIDLVLMDIMMPEMDGYETMQRVRAQPKFKNLPILALTAKAMKGDLEKCIEAGANDYLSKPIDNDRLFSMLRVWLYR